MPALLINNWYQEENYFLDGPFQASFYLFFVISIVQLVDEILPMSGFELQISSVISDRSTNWATTTAQEENMFAAQIVLLPGALTGSN